MGIVILLLAAKSEVRSEERDVDIVSSSGPPSPRSQPPEVRNPGVPMHEIRWIVHMKSVVRASRLYNEVLE